LINIDIYELFTDEGDDACRSGSGLASFSAQSDLPVMSCLIAVLLIEHPNHDAVPIMPVALFLLRVVNGMTPGMLWFNSLFTQRWSQFDADSSFCTMNYDIPASCSVVRQPFSLKSFNSILF
jgi:hypothetical protein